MSKIIIPFKELNKSWYHINERKEDASVQYEKMHADIADAISESAKREIKRLKEVVIPILEKSVISNPQERSLWNRIKEFIGIKKAK